MSAQSRVSPRRAQAYRDQLATRGRCNVKAQPELHSMSASCVKPEKISHNTWGGRAAKIQAHMGAWSALGFRLPVEPEDPRANW